PEFLLYLITEKVPALEVAGAELALLVLLVAGPHPGDAALDLGSVAERGNQLRYRDGFVADGVFGIGHISIRPKTYHDPVRYRSQPGRPPTPPRSTLRTVPK